MLFEKPARLNLPSSMSKAPHNIELRTGDVVAVVNPQGAYLESLRFADTDLLLPRQQLEEYVDGETVVKDRGGIPICTPYFGPFEGERHGYGRKEYWERELTANKQQAALTHVQVTGLFAGLESRLSYQIAQRDESVILIAQLALKNTGASAVPVSPGFHPYFPSRPGVENETISYGDRKLVHGREWRTENTEFITVGDGEAAVFAVPDYRVTMKSTNLRKYAIWSGRKSTYWCVEPTRDGNAFENGVPQAEELMLKPAEEAVFECEIIWRRNSADVPVATTSEAA